MFFLVLHVTYYVIIQLRDDIKSTPNDSLKAWAGSAKKKKGVGVRRLLSLRQPLGFG